MIEVRCPTCAATLHVADRYAGHTGTCTGCGGKLQIPRGVEHPHAEVSGKGADTLAATSQPPAEDSSSHRLIGPMRPDTGMLATEGEVGGGLGASFGRMAILLCALSIIAACVLPAIVVGFSAETAPAEPERSIVLPATRGSAPTPIPAAHVASDVESTPPVTPDPHPVANGARTVYVTRSDRRYHEESCSHLRGGSAVLRLNEAEARGYSPCGTCGS